MAVFSTNQVRHLYAAKKFKTDAVAEPGDIKVGGDTDTIYFEYHGSGEHGKMQMRSDLIKIDSIVWARHTPAATQARPLKKVTVTLDADYLVDGKVLPGQDYILRIVFRQFAGMSDEDVYIKYGAVHGTRNMTAADFYKEMAKSLTKNFSRELTKLLTFTPLTDGSGLVIEEVEQDWTLGVKQQTPVYFEVIPTTITFDGEEVVWAKDSISGKAVKVEDSDKTIPNSKQLADLEYFCMGERGDIYRNVGWPNVIPTKYILDGDDADGYDVLDIHYYYEGGGENPQKSEKDITIVAKSDVIGSADDDESIIKALKDKGITVTVVK